MQIDPHRLAKTRLLTSLAPLFDNVDLGVSALCADSTEELNRLGFNNGGAFSSLILDISKYEIFLRFLLCSSVSSSVSSLTASSSGCGNLRNKPQLQNYTPSCTEEKHLQLPITNIDS